MHTPLTSGRTLRFLLTFSACFLFIISSFGQSKTLSYRFTMDTIDTLLHVQLEFKGSKSGKTILQLPDQWAGQADLFGAIRQLSVSGKKAELSAGETGAQRIVTHAPNALLTVHYTLKQDRPNELTYPNNFRAVIQPDYFQFTGYSLFVHPEMDLGIRVTVNFDWSGLPADWKVGNSLHANSRKHKGKLQLGDLQNSVFVAGDFRSYETRIHGKPVFVAIRGKDWELPDSSFVSRVNTIISMERTFWDDFSEPYYFVSLIPFDGQGSYNGTSLHQSFMLAMTPDMMNGSYLDILMAHEYFHHWNGTTILLHGGVEQENSWFSEGFTEFYTYKLLYENGFSSHKTYLSKVNEMITAYYLSPVRNEDKATHGANYWKTTDYHQIPYKKGFVYALYIDQLIRSSSHNTYSLDNVMFDMRDLQKKKQLLTDSTFTDLVRHYSGKDISHLQQQYINEGETIPVVAGSLENTELLMQETGSFEVGFDVDASIETKIVAGVKEGGAAWKAGLRDGQVIKGISIYTGDVTQPAEIYILQNDEEVLVSYMPVSEQRIEVPQFQTVNR
jgi:predicted metalloprotease with PDZ domain